MQVLDSLIDGALQLGNRREGDELMGMIVRYLRTGDEPSPRTEAQRMALTMVAPVLDKSRRRAEAGSRGGSKRGSKATLGHACEAEGREEADPIPYAEIVGALNEAAGTSYRPTSGKTRALIRARWAEGFRLPDFERVAKVMAAEWGGDAKMSGYLRPETLFGTKFEGYLQRPAAREGAQGGNPFDGY